MNISRYFHTKNNSVCVRQTTHDNELTDTRVHNYFYEYISLLVANTFIFILTMETPKIWPRIYCLLPKICSEADFNLKTLKSQFIHATNTTYFKTMFLHFMASQNIQTNLRLSSKLDSKRLFAYQILNCISSFSSGIIFSVHLLSSKQKKNMNSASVTSNCQFVK